MDKNFRFIGNNAQWRNIAKGAIRHILHQGVLYFKNVIRFHITLFIIISFMRIRKWPSNAQISCTKFGQ
jgi:hypothetical protein